MDLLEGAASSHWLPRDRALSNHQPDASLATGPFTGGCHTAGVSQRESPERGFSTLALIQSPLSTLGRVDLIFRASAYHRGLLKLTRKMRNANAALCAAFSMQGSAGAHAPRG